MSDEKDRIQDEDVEGHKKAREDTTGDDTEGHMPRWEDTTGDDDVEGHKNKVREDTTGDDDTEGHRRI